MLYTHSSTVSLSFRETPNPCYPRSSQSDGGIAAQYHPSQAPGWKRTNPCPQGASSLVEATQYTTRRDTPDPTCSLSPPPRPKKGVGLSGATRQQRFGEGMQVSWRSGRLVSVGCLEEAAGGLAGCTEEAAPGRSHDPGKTVWAPSPVSGPAVGAPRGRV